MPRVRKHKDEHWFRQQESERVKAIRSRKKQQADIQQKELKALRDFRDFVNHFYPVVFTEYQQIISGQQNVPSSSADVSPQQTFDSQQTSVYVEDQNPCLLPLQNELYGDMNSSSAQQNPTLWYRHDVSTEVNCTRYTPFVPNDDLFTLNLDEYLDNTSLQEIETIALNTSELNLDEYLF